MDFEQFISNQKEQLDGKGLTRNIFNSYHEGVLQVMKAAYNQAIEDAKIDVAEHCFPTKEVTQPINASLDKLKKP